MTLRLQGRLDASLAERLDTDLREIIRAGEHRVVLDLAAVDYLSSAGIRFLLKTYQALGKLGGSCSIVNPAPAVKSVLELSGMTLLMQGRADQPMPAAPPVSPPAARKTCKGSALYEVYETTPGATLAWRLAGDPSRLEQLGFGPDDGETVALGEDTLALGLGRFQQPGADAPSAVGEFMAVGGTAVCLPADGNSVPDYMLSTGMLVPRVRALYAAICRGPLRQCIRFDASENGARESFSGLIGAALELANAKAVGVVMLAESAGLIGAALKRAPVGRGAEGSLFAHPGIRDWLNFTPERIHERCLALVAGIATNVRDDALAPCVRPMGLAPLPAGHFHAAAFAFQAMPKGPLALKDTLAALFEDAAPLALIHLVNDCRQINGAGESLFIRGAMWLGPIEVGRGNG